MTVDLNAIWVMAVAWGIPTAVTGFLVRKLEKRMAKTDEIRDEQERAREKSEVLLVKSVGAAISLGEAAAIALKNGKCNGETEAALEYARKIKNEQKDFLLEQGIRGMY